jgi:DNA excision repair protein ERCC-2
LNEAVPGNIRRAEHFVAFLKKIVQHLKSRLRTIAGPNGGVTAETPLAFLHRMTNGTSLEAKPLKFAYSRLSSLLRTLQVSNLDEFNSLTDVADFVTLLASYSEGIAKFAIIMEPNGSSVPGAVDPVIQLACLDSSLAIAPLFKRFGSVIITSGTLSPIDLYPKLLQFEPCVSESFSMFTFRPCIRPLVITRGSDQLAVSTKFEDRGDMGVVRNVVRDECFPNIVVDECMLTNYLYCDFVALVLQVPCLSNFAASFRTESWHSSRRIATWNR